MREYLVAPDRFWRFVTKRPDGCWEWTGARDQAGYGRFHGNRDGKHLSLLAHRVAFALANGYVPPCVCHHCDNRPCVNPAHLFPGRHLENARDMMLKGRHASQIGTPWHAQGTDHPLAKLTEADIPIIRAMSTAGATQRQIAHRYGVCQRTITKILIRKGWTHA